MPDGPWRRPGSGRAVRPGETATPTGRDVRGCPTAIAPPRNRAMPRASPIAPTSASSRCGGHQALRRARLDRPTRARLRDRSGRDDPRGRLRRRHDVVSPRSPVRMPGGRRRHLEAHAGMCPQAGPPPRRRGPDRVRGRRRAGSAVRRRHVRRRHRRVGRRVRAGQGASARGAPLGQRREDDWIAAPDHLTAPRPDRSRRDRTSRARTSPRPWSEGR